MLELKHVSVRFRSRSRSVDAVRDASLHVKPAEVFGIVGASGAGKSTLLRTINLLERPSDGEIWSGGRNIALLRGEVLRKERLNIGMVFQHFNLLHSQSIFENIALPLRAAGKKGPAIQTRVEELLELVELGGMGKALPSQLSGGQKQRVGIARALANHPGILLCDEPTSALDLETTESILNLLAGINKKLGVTIVIISHEMAVIKKICHRVAVMKDGVIVENKPVYELFANPEHPFTRELVEKALGLKLPDRVFDKQTGTILRLVFLGTRAEEPILNEATRRFGVHSNILHGRIEYIDDRPIGILIVSLDGQAQQVRDAIEYFQHNVARLEVIRSVPS
ncbi:MAG: methionine ABC transporter ATP-binding protein [Chthoniobacteraceae bacterium]